FEFGCNAGWNLSAIQEVSRAKCTGIDINSEAAIQAQGCGLDVAISGEIDVPEMYPSELVLTCGVLIHVAPKDLPGTMERLVDVSCDYLLAIEYASESGAEEPIEYRGQQGLLWRRDFGKLYEEFGLKLVDKGDPGKAFDRC